MSFCNADPKVPALASLRSRIWVALLCALCACAGSHPCSGGESCNGKDDDCDGKTDEDFRDRRGRYVSDDHCGRCGISCSEVFPSASITGCDADPAVPECRLLACEIGFHPAGGGACVRDEIVQCLPCEADSDCAARLAGSRCVEQAGEGRCALPCDAAHPCAGPFACNTAAGLCEPEPRLCACDGVSDTFEVACIADGAARGLACAGVRTCGPDGLGPCEIAAAETCNGKDDDCDGQSDEDFVDEQGRYADRLHCGSCGTPCVAPGANYVATCVPDGTSALCNVTCAEGFVDVDLVQGNGCECQIFDGTNAPVIVGGDADCDGVIDDDDTFVHVTSGGSDEAEGTLVAPVRTIEKGLALGASQNKPVLVAQGTYAPFSAVAGVSVFGGYRSDFRDRDSERYPVFVEHEGASDGAPVLGCDGVVGSLVIDGFTFVGDDAESEGMGSTALYFDRCGPGVKLAHVTVVAGRGADGAPGADASESEVLLELAGEDGATGRKGDDNGVACATVSGGQGGTKRCDGRDVSGGSGGASTCPDLGCENGQPCANAGCTDFTSGGVCDYETVLSLAISNPRAGDGQGSSPGRAGAPTYNAPTNRTDCNFCDDNPTLERLGQDGRDGALGASGEGGAGCSARSLEISSGGRVRARGGADGTSGTDGSGGGGGSAGNGYSVIAGTVGECDDNAGGSGGGGGSGGCGAPGGLGGGGGGASIGIVVEVTGDGDGPTFEDVRVITDSGGRGGDGGIGAAGGAGGEGARGGLSQFWCARNGGRGGNGGPGGAGGGGGGGCGGPSHAVLLRGAPSASYPGDVRDGLTVERTGVPGQGGSGGFSPGERGRGGRDGDSEAVAVR